MTLAAYTVSQLTALVGGAIAGVPDLEDVLVEGEISNLTRPASGHWYFTLKDGGAQLSCVCFRSNALRVPFAPSHGLAVVAHGQVTVYAQQGRYQLVVDRLEPAGIGALALAVEQRRRALAAEGLFDESRKRALPLLPRRVAVVTSRAGAALHDVLTVMSRRAPCVDVVFSSALVQGDGAAETIVSALARAGRVSGAEVVLLVRGGGALEDLMAFNDVEVARAIRACPVPVVTGIGHETDTTIADLAADRRAATPSAAAETAVPSCSHLRQELVSRRRRLRDSLRQEIATKRAAAERRTARLAQLSPAARTVRLRHDVDERRRRLAQALLGTVTSRRRRLDAQRAALELHSPVRALPLQRERLAVRRERLAAAAAGMVRAQRTALASADRRLFALSPLAVLDRGYSITVDAVSGTVIREAAGVAGGSRLRTRLRSGSLLSEVVPEPVRPPSGERMYDDAAGDPATTTGDGDG